MHNEIKRFCAAQKWREAIDFVARIKPGPHSGKTDGLIYIGTRIIGTLPQGAPRDGLLDDIIDGLLQLGDTEHSRIFILALLSGALQEKYAVVLQKAMRTRMDDGDFEE